jgi:hypothetical protein
MTGRSAVGAYIGPGMAGTAVLRDMADPGVTRTCRGDGTLVTQQGVAGSVNGLDGEVHDDGEIWNGFFWELHQGLKSGGWRACGGACDAGPAIQYAAVKLAGGTSPTLATYWTTMRSAASALFPGKPEVAAYVECVALRRGFDLCDRTVPVYAGETKAQFIRLRYSPFQVSFTADASGTGVVAVCSGAGTSTTIHLRKGQPVALTAIDPQTLNATVTSDFSFTMAQPCNTGSFTLTLDVTDGGTWYMLLDAPNAVVGANPGSDTYKVVLSGTGFASRPATPAPPTCTPPLAPAGPLVISPSSATVARGGSLTFTAFGGSGTGYTWSLQTNASGGAIVAGTGVYTAGSTGGVTDVVRVTDSLGASATANLTIPAATSGGGGSGGGGGGGGGGCAAGGEAGVCSLVLLAALAARRRRGVALVHAEHEA